MKGGKDAAGKQDKTRKALLEAREAQQRQKKELAALQQQHAVDNERLKRASAAQKPEQIDLNTALQKLKASIATYFTMRPTTGFRYWLSSIIGWFTRAKRVDAANTLNTALETATSEKLPDNLEAILGDYEGCIINTRHRILPSKNDRSETILSAIDTLRTSIPPKASL